MLDLPTIPTCLTAYQLTYMPICLSVYLLSWEISMVQVIRPSPSERLFWWQVWKIFIPSLHTVTNVTVWRLGMKNSYLSPSGNFIPKWWQIWILFIWWHTIWWHIHIDMKMNIFFRWWHVQTVTSMILMGEWYFFQMVTSSYGDNLKFSDHLPVTVWNL